MSKFAAVSPEGWNGYLWSGSLFYIVFLGRRVVITRLLNQPPQGTQRGGVKLFLFKAGHDVFCQE
jgi:hypothetical protein